MTELHKDEFAVQIENSKTHWPDTVFINEDIRISGKIIKSWPTRLIVNGNVDIDFCFTDFEPTKELFQITGNANISRTATLLSKFKYLSVKKSLTFKESKVFHVNELHVENDLIVNTEEGSVFNSSAVVVGGNMFCVGTKHQFPSNLLMVKGELVLGGIQKGIDKLVMPENFIVGGNVTLREENQQHLPEILQDYKMASIVIAGVCNLNALIDKFKSRIVNPHGLTIT